HRRATLELADAILTPEPMLPADICVGRFVITLGKVRGPGADHPLRAVPTFDTAGPATSRPGYLLAPRTAASCADAEHQPVLARRVARGIPHDLRSAV